MATTTTQLITDSYYLSSVLSEEFNTITSYELNKGLRLLNYLIVFKTADKRLIPYFTENQFYSAVNTEKYAIDGLIEVETLTYDWQTIRYPMQLMSRSQYFATARANNVQTLPSQFHVEKRRGGCDIYIYPFPNIDEYHFKLYGKFSLPTVALGEVLEDKYDPFYIEYFRYGLAEMIAQDYQITFAPQCKEMLTFYERKLFDNSPIDFTVKKQSMLQSGVGRPDIWYEANILKGWYPS